MGCDTIIVDALADDLSAELQILRAPSVEYGVNAVHERTVPGNATLRRKTLLRALNDLTDTWEAGGICEFIFLTAHGHEGHQEALSTVITKGARVRVVDILSINVTDLTTSQLAPLHGDEIDTSLLLYLAPNLVRMDLAEDYMNALAERGSVHRATLKVRGAPHSRQRRDWRGHLHSYSQQDTGSHLYRSAPNGVALDWRSQALNGVQPIGYN
jgi:creatinine amidohydrolase